MPTLFNQPPVVLAALSRNDFLKLLRERINKSYMPSATGDRKTNSKPNYVSSILVKKPVPIGEITLDLLMTPALYPFDTTGFFCATDIHGYSFPDGPVFALITAEGYQFRVNLKTDQIGVRQLNSVATAQEIKEGGSPTFIQWDNEEDTLVINPYLLIENLDTYL